LNSAAIETPGCEVGGGGLVVVVVVVFVDASVNGFGADVASRDSASSSIEW
jgi:hypothetical protein